VFIAAIVRRERLGVQIDAIERKRGEVCKSTPLREREVCLLKRVSKERQEDVDVAKERGRGGMADDDARERG